MSLARRFALLEIAFLSGVAGESLHRAVFVVACIVLASLFLRPRSAVFSLAILALAVLGVVHMQNSGVSVRHDTLHLHAGETVRMRGFLSQEPDRRLDEQRLTVRIFALGDPPQSARGNTLTVTALYPVYRYGEEVTLRCKLDRPEPIEGFAYDEYLAVSHIFTICRFAQIKKTGAMLGSPILRILFQLKEKLLSGVAAGFVEPHASLLGGILLGARQGIPESVSADFRAAGLSHIVALSGYNISILAAAVLALCLRARLSRPQAFWVVTVGLVVFVCMTGASPSVVRASVMGFLVVLARRSGRMGKIWYGLVFAATMMAIVNPRVLIFDVGFQLSFLATMGLVQWSGWFVARCQWVPERFGLRDALASTLAATTATLPIILSQFGRLSLVSPIANILILPLMPMIMLLGTLALLPLIGSLAALATSLGLTWVIQCAHVLAHLPMSNIAVTIPWLWWLLLLGIFVIVTLWRKKIQKPEAH